MLLGLSSSSGDMQIPSLRYGMTNMVRVVACSWQASNRGENPRYFLHTLQYLR